MAEQILADIVAANAKLMVLNLLNHGSAKFNSPPKNLQMQHNTTARVSTITLSDVYMYNYSTCTGFSRTGDIHIHKYMHM